MEGTRLHPSRDGCDQNVKFYKQYDLYKWKIFPSDSKIQEGQGSASFNMEATWQGAQKSCNNHNPKIMMTHLVIKKIC